MARRLAILPASLLVASFSYILISHDLAVVRQLTDETLLRHRGTAVERGPAAASSMTPGTLTTSSCAPACRGQAGNPAGPNLMQIV